jgi:transcriptional regulator with GAF, ATPase, and Fis domain
VRYDLHMGRAAEQLLDALNASTTLDEVQDAFVACVDGLIDVPAHAIYYLDPVSLAPLCVRTRGASDSFLAGYEDAGRAIDPVLERVAVEGRTVRSRCLLDDHSWRAHPFYPVVAQGGFESTMQAPIVVEGELVGTLDFARRRRDGSFRAGEARLLDVVARRVSDAVARALRFEELARQSTLRRSTRRSCSRTAPPRTCSSAPGALRGRCRRRSRRRSPPTPGGWWPDGDSPRPPSRRRSSRFRCARGNGRSAAVRRWAASRSVRCSPATAAP